MKKTVHILIIVVITVSLSCVLAAGTYFDISVDEASEVSLKNDINIEIKNININGYEKKAAEEVEKQKYYLLGFLSERIKNIVNPFNAETQVEKAKFEKRDYEDSIKLSIYKKSLQIALKEKEIEKQKVLDDIYKIKYENVLLKYEKGITGINEVNSWEINLNTRKYNLDELNDSLEVLKLELKALMHVELDSSISIADSLLTVESPSGINDYIEKTMEYSSGLYALKRNEEAAKTAFDMTVEAGYQEGSEEYDSAYLDYLKSRAEHINARENLELSIRKEYIQLENLFDKISIAEYKLKKAKESMDDMKQKYEQKLIGYNDYLSYEEDYEAAKYNKYAAVYNYNAYKAEMDKKAGVK